MKSLNIVFGVITMLAVVFTVSVLPQQKKNFNNGQMFIQEKMMEAQRGQHPNISGIQNEEPSWEQQRLSLPNKFDRKVGKFSKILSDTIYVPISRVIEEWDTIANVWVSNQKETCSIGANGNVAEVLVQMWNDSVWVDSLKYIFSYDANQNLREKLKQRWNDSVWVNGWKTTYSYDANGNLTEYFHQYWYDSTWVNDLKNTYTYDVSGNCTEWLVQGWGWNGSVWVNGWKTTYTYDENGNLTEHLEEIWSGSEWENSYKHTYTYDANGNMIEVLGQEWYSSVWVIYSKSTCSYDANGNRTGLLVQEWYSSMWVNFMKIVSTYDANRNLTELLIQMWKGSVWVNSEKQTFTWQRVIIDDVNEQVNAIGSFALSANYPNPFNPLTKISFSIPKESYITLKVYDLLGREVATLVNEKKRPGEYSVTWSTEGVTSGVYFYRLVAGEIIETKRMVVMK